MQRVLSILFGAGFTVAVCWACGALLLRRLRVDLDPLETALFAFLSGAALASVGVFLLCVVHQARAGVFLVGGAVLIAGAVWQGAGKGKRLPPIPRSWIVSLVLALAPYLFAYSMNALAPEVSPDGSGYHLGEVQRCWEAHGFLWSFHSIYSAFPHGLEMLFLIAFAFGAHSAAALVHFAFLVTLPLLMLCYGRRFGLERAACFAAIVVVVSPVFGLTGTSAYNDAALVTLSFAVFYLLQVKTEFASDNHLILIGLFAGFSFAIKYTGGLAAVFAVAMFLFSRRRINWFKLAFPAALVAVPWLIRNWIWIGNPLAPFFNRWFPNPLFTASLEQSYLSDIGRFGAFHHWWEFPLDVTIYGARIPGFLGPVFLLAPFALLALRRREGRQLLVAAVFFAVPMAFNAATRFLMPGIPFLALALGMALENSHGILPLLALAEALFCWPSLMPLYSADWSWRMREIPVRAALRIEPEAEFIRRRIPDYTLKPAIERYADKTKKLFSFASRPEAYLDRTIMVGYESAEGDRLQRLLVQAAEHPELRRSATAELKRNDIKLLLINPTDAVAPSLNDNPSSWGVTALAESHGTILYVLD